MQPKFRLFDNKAKNDDISAASTTVVQTDNESRSQPKELNNEDKPLDAVSQLTNPQDNTPPKSQTQNKPTKPLLESPISLPLPVLPSCDESKRNDYEATYHQDVETENTFHDAEVNRILGLGLLDALLTETLDSETARHQNVLSDLKVNLDRLLATIACS